MLSFFCNLWVGFSIWCLSSYQFELCYVCVCTICPSQHLAESYLTCLFTHFIHYKKIVFSWSNNCIYAFVFLPWLLLIKMIVFYGGWLCVLFYAETLKTWLTMMGKCLGNVQDGLLFSMKGSFLQCPEDLLLRIPGMIWRLVNLVA